MQCVNAALVLWCGTNFGVVFKKKCMEQVTAAPPQGIVFATKRREKKLQRTLGRKEEAEENLQIHHRSNDAENWLHV